MLVLFDDRVCSETTIAAGATGLGAPVIEMIGAAKFPAPIAPPATTGGVNANHSNGGIWHVPKNEQGGVRIPDGLPGCRDLQEVP